MEVRRQVLVLLVIASVLCVKSAAGQFNQCTSQQRCTEFNMCPEFKNYVNKPATTWPRQVQEQVKQRICNMQKRGSTKIYYVCCNLQSTSAHQPSGGMALLDMSSCGKNAMDRIAFGKAARVFEYPWMALLLDDDDQIQCGGTLIAQKYVLTAAHCDRPPIATVRLGENDISKPIDCNIFGEDMDCADPPQDIPVDKFIKHPHHSPAKRKNDIALVRLLQPARFSDSVKTICLPIAPVLRNPTPSEMIVSGWGYTEHGTTANVLQFAKIPVVPNPQCASILNRLDDAISLDDSQFCAGGLNKVDNCAGDSGGPLQYYSRTSAFVQHGVVSFGVNSCGVDSTPGVYTKVSHYIDWILDNLK